MLRNYLKVAGKVLLRRKFFTFISLFGIGFTLLVLVVATAMLENLFSSSPPEIHAHRSLLVMDALLKGPTASSTGPPGYALLDRHVRTLPDVERVTVLTMPDRFPIFHEGRKIPIFFRRTDGAFWDVMRFEFLEGGPFGADDDRAGNRVAVINRTLRERLFGDGPALGKTFTADGQGFRVVGVVRDVPITRIASFSEVWAPIGSFKDQGFRHRLRGDFMAVIVARSRADFAGIRAELAHRLSQVQIPEPQYERVNAWAETLFEHASRQMQSGDPEHARPHLLRALLFAAMVLFMLLPTINLVNVNLSRILERASEIGVRKAFGAPARALVGQFVVENVILTLIGGAIAALLATVVLGALNQSGIIPYAQFRLNPRVLGWGLLIALFFGLLSGVYPAWRMSRMHPVEALRGRSM